VDPQLEARYQSAAEFAQAMRHLFGEAPERRPAVSGRMLLLFALAALAILLLVLAAWATASAS
jgi:hypothetical protein